FAPDDALIDRRRAVGNRPPPPSRANASCSSPFPTESCPACARPRSYPTVSLGVCNCLPRGHGFALGGATGGRIGNRLARCGLTEGLGCRGGPVGALRPAHSPCRSPIDRLEWRRRISPRGT